MTNGLGTSKKLPQVKNLRFLHGLAVVYGKQNKQDRPVKCI